MVSAGPGFLFSNLCRVDRMRMPACAGFIAVERHSPCDTGAMELQAVLAETRRNTLGLNAVPGHISAGGLGLCVLPGLKTQTRAATDPAIAYGAGYKPRGGSIDAGPGWLEKFRKELL